MASAKNHITAIRSEELSRWPILAGLSGSALKLLLFNDRFNGFKSSTTGELIFITLDVGGEKGVGPGECEECHANEGRLK